MLFTLSKKIRSIFSLSACLAVACGCQAGDANLEMTLSANIVENTCQISVSDGGQVHLPTVGKGWFYNADGSSRLAPTDAAAGTAFSIKVENCPGDNITVNSLNFSFQPQNGQWPTGSKQVFINETPVTASGADNVGIVIFSTAHHTNVLNSDGTSNVTMNIENSAWAAEYEFYARLQNTGPVSTGKITSNVLVSTIYN
ncbi:fimbrial-like protein [Citrobacter sp. Igbk 16]|uniref:fimbrial-like protein n=1 Tax=Citrobacter sp. Igbk 16 TaxID=2963958 RepID=UPI002304A56B|nr:fimbrial-like protein [Citrobacter sp. Igbk 16]MDA8517928.1 fimbrial-like protein [Citrobacter sp. Igbk 16]